MSVPQERIRRLNDAPVRPERTQVLYWMVAARRTGWSFALDRAVELAHELGKPLLVLEALRVGYPNASDRLHRFILQGMGENARALDRAGVRHLAYVEPKPGDGGGLLSALAEHSCAVVTDDFPTFFIPHMLRAAAEKLDVQLEAVDSNGLYPMRATPRVFPTAFAFRRHLQRDLPLHFEFPSANPLARRKLPRHPGLPKKLLQRWPQADAKLLAGDTSAIAKLPIDHRVPPVSLDGGTGPARKRLRAFLRDGLEAYGEGRNHPDDDASSGLSPWLHFGHLSPHEIFDALARETNWRLGKLGRVTGKREGFWNLSPTADAFLDELITWRELGLNFASHRDDYADFDALPVWALKTLEKHQRDKREAIYDLATLEAAETSDEVWNAAQRQLVREGRIHNYLRMLWGKRVLGWTRTPREAAQILIALNDRWALDGRDANSYSGIFWVFGRYDRPWGPERPVFGTVRYMSSANTVRKLRMKQYLARYSNSAP
ncbi:MAG: deoxyribodipyrimidine photolyase [Deltaproteobacteria bacterium]|nr:deoxyribodipyrimidine photolyase [Deltaproteobacteria bacterium]